jgi:copper chaperone
MKEGRMSQSFRVKGMTCQGCVAAVTRAVQSVAPRAEISVDLAAERVDVRGDADPRALVAAIENAGFTVRPS